jgi:hypothetical protein
MKHLEPFESYDHNFRNADREKEKYVETSKIAYKLAKQLKNVHGYKFTKESGVPAFEVTYSGKPATTEAFDTTVNLLVTAFNLVELDPGHKPETDLSPATGYRKTEEVRAYTLEGKYTVAFVRTQEYINTQTHLVFVIDPTDPPDPECGHIPKRYMVYFGYR